MLHHIQLIQMLMKMYNFRIRYRITDQWTGLRIATMADDLRGQLKLLNDSEAILSVTPFLITADRMKYTDYTILTWFPRFDLSYYVP